MLLSLTLSVHCTPMSVHTWVQVPADDRGIGCPETGATGDSEIPSVSAGNQT